MVRVLAIGAVLAACQGTGGSTSTGSAAKDASRVAVGSDDGSGAAGSDVADGSGSATNGSAGSAGSAAAIEEPEPPADPSRRIAELGAIPAWQAVIDRTQYLGRRNQQGIIYGTLGATVMVPAPPPDGGSGSAAPRAGSGSAPSLVASPYTWLADDTDGNGALGFRVMLGTQVANPGERVAVTGAWELDPARRYYWKVEKLEKLPAREPSKTDVKDPPSPIPSHAIANGELPQGARTISLARDNDAVYFQIVGPPPINDGDGWAVADELGDPVAALLVLPGERSTYGNQDMRTPDERWSLRRGVTYWVRIGKVRRKAPDKPMLLNARTAPVRVR